MWRHHWHVVWSFAICESCRLKALLALQNAFAFGWQFNHNVSGWIHGPEEVTVWFPKHWKIGKWWTCKSWAYFTQQASLDDLLKLRWNLRTEPSNLLPMTLRIAILCKKDREHHFGWSLYDKSLLWAHFPSAKSHFYMILRWEIIYFWSYADGCMKRVYRLNLQRTWPFHLPNRLIWCFAEATANAKLGFKKTDPSSSKTVGRFPSCED